MSAAGAFLGLGEGAINEHRAVRGLGTDRKAPDGVASLDTSS
jgi:hypothetical protein